MSSFKVIYKIKEHNLKLQHHLFYYLKIIIVRLVLVFGVVGEGAVPHQDACPPTSLVNEKDLGEHDYTEHREEHDHDEKTHVGPLPVPKRDVTTSAPAARPHVAVTVTKMIGLLRCGGIIQFSGSREQRV